MHWALRAIAAIAALLLAAFGVALVIVATGTGQVFSWIFGLVLILIAVGLGVVVFKAAGRPCPRCAKSVPKGIVVCPTCGFDFNAVVPQAPPSST